MRETEKNDICVTLEDVKLKVQIEKPWQVVDNDTTNDFTTCTLQKSRDAGAFVEKCSTIDENLMLTCYVQSVKLSSLENFQFPLKVNSLCTIEAVRDLLANMQTSSCTNFSDSQFTLTLQLVLSMLIPLKSRSFKFHGVIWFIYEQMRLITQSVYNYSYNFLFFASFLQHFAKRLPFFRTSDNCLLPCYNTICKITLSKAMSSLIEQHDSTFLCYVKEKVITYSQATRLLCF